jgi:hypothetical protein
MFMTLLAYPEGLSVSPTSDDLMIKRVLIKNFRSFEDTGAEDLARMNVIVGDNGSGKTGLLEALYLASGNSAQQTLSLRIWRGLTLEAVVASSFADLWRDLFYRFDTQREIAIRVSGTRDGTRGFSMRSQPDPEVTVGSADSQTVLNPVLMEWTDANGAKRRGNIRVEKGRVAFQAVPPGIKGLFVPASAAPNLTEMATRFSELAIRSQEDRLIASFSRLFPAISGISIQTELGTGVPILYATIAETKEKMPLSLVSGAVMRVLSMMLGIAGFPGGAIFVDEIENGVYYKRLPLTWELINEFSKEHNTQLFIATHSREALEALVPILKENESDFRLIRVSKDAEAKSYLKVINGSNFLAALEEDFEVR